MKGRAAKSNPNNRFNKEIIEHQVFDISDEQESLKTEFIPTFPKTIVNKVISKDLPFVYSVNPYQGCEHGCIYCYARPTHNYWGYSSGIDFEQKILVKRNVVSLLKKKIQHKNWQAAPIMLSGNTDCYQPAEAKYKITRSILETLYNHRHPVSIITKNRLILRDLDILKKLSKLKLVSVAISITTLDRDLQRILEPRTAIPSQRLSTMKTLSSEGIPVMAMMAPIIPGLTNHEIMDVAKASADNGALSLGSGLVRLNHDLDLLFSEWLEANLPDKKEKILNHIKEIRKGKLSATIGENRMKGTGVMAEIIQAQLKLAKKRFFPKTEKLLLNCTLHEQYKTSQLSLF